MGISPTGRELSALSIISDHSNALSTGAFAASAGASGLRSTGFAAAEKIVLGLILGKLRNIKLIVVIILGT